MKRRYFAVALVLGLVASAPACILIGYDPSPWNEATPVGDGGFAPATDSGTVTQDSGAATQDSGVQLDGAGLVDGSMPGAGHIDAAALDGGDLNDGSLGDADIADGSRADGAVAIDGSIRDGAETGPVCDDEMNDCGGCAVLVFSEGDDCGACGEGEYVCDGKDALKCERAEVGVNGCGGCAQLDTRPGDACGSCGQGKYACAGGDGLVCRNAEVGVNGCGGCEILNAEPGSGCGTCGLGQYTCAGSNAVSCIGGDAMPIGTSGLLIDDFEDGDRFANIQGGISGAWNISTDGTPSGWTSPSAGSDFVADGSGANGSLRSAEISGAGYSEWGVAFALTLNGAGCAYDARGTSGITFYARGSVPANSSVRFATGTIATVPVGAGPGDCVVGPNNEACYDNFGVDLTLADDWQLFTVPWSSLRQSGWGGAETFQREDMLYIEFGLPTTLVSSDFDVAFDELRFY